MSKTHLQRRAREAALRFGVEARKPIVIEFAGVPKAGKTSTISQVQTFFKRCGFRVKVVVERASVCPIRDKKHANFNVWTACTTLSQILEHTQEPPHPDDPQILILDRGLFDSICWLRTMDRLSRIRSADREIVESFLLLPEWRKRISGVIVMLVSPEDAMKREQGFLPVKTQGSIMNPDVLKQTIETTKKTVERLGDKFQIFTIDTTPGRPQSKPEDTAERVADIMLNLIEDQLHEEILYLPKETIRDLFADNVTLDDRRASDVRKSFVEQGMYKPRDEVERDDSVVQALPVVVVRKKNGEILRLRRREKRPDNVLNEKLVIWAGGHVRREDATNGDAIVQCIVRELAEELRLSIEPEELRLLGAVYVNTGKTTPKHTALVFEWKAETDDVAVTLCSSEFFERRGTSLSGTFITPDQLTAELESGGIAEPWSVEIARHLLGSRPDTGKLF